MIRSAISVSFDASTSLAQKRLEFRAQFGLRNTALHRCSPHPSEAAGPSAVVGNSRIWTETLEASGAGKSCPGMCARWQPAQRWMGKSGHCAKRKHAGDRRGYKSQWQRTNGNGAPVRVRKNSLPINRARLKKSQARHWTGLTPANHEGLPVLSRGCFNPARSRTGRRHEAGLDAQHERGAVGVCARSAATAAASRRSCWCWRLP